MAELSLTDILDGISLKLHTAYPAGHIYAGSIPQGIKPGDFNIIPVFTEQEHKLGVRYSQTAVFDVIYYGRSACADEYMPIVNNVMMLLCDIITPNGDTLHASSISSQTDLTERVLHISLTFNVRVFVSEERVKMETLKIQQEG